MMHYDSFTITLVRWTGSASYWPSVPLTSQAFALESLIEAAWVADKPELRAG